MTESEALEILKRDDDDMRKGYFCLNDFAALEVAKNALEKQIAVKKTILDYSAMPRVMIDEKLYVDKKIFVGYALRLLEEEMKDAQSEDEKYGYEVSMQILGNM